ncbi:MAG: hypothetical protein ACJ77A_10550 [Actinomycetota bacterium]
MKLIDVARSAVPGEQVLAAGIFRAGGSATARLAGFGELSARRREQEMRRASGLEFKRYLMLVVTHERLYAFDARARFTSWKAGPRLAVWSRSAIQAAADGRYVTLRLTLNVQSEGRLINLEAPKTSRESAGQVARLLIGGDRVPTPVEGLEHGVAWSEEPVGRGGLAPWGPPTPVETDESRRLHNRAGWLAVAGGVGRFLAYLLPWVVVSRADGLSEGVTISAFHLLHPLIFSFAYSVAIIVVGVVYLRGHREAAPRLLVGWGLSAVVVFLWQFSATMDSISQARARLGPALGVTFGLGFGVFVELAGVLMILAGAVAARKAANAMAPPPEYRDASA